MVRSEYVVDRCERVIHTIVLCVACKPHTTAAVPCAQSRSGSCRKPFHHTSLRTHMKELYEETIADAIKEGFVTTRKRDGRPKCASDFEPASIVHLSGTPRPIHVTR